MVSNHKPLILSWPKVLRISQMPNNFNFFSILLSCIFLATNRTEIKSRERRDSADLGAKNVKDFTQAGAKREAKHGRMEIRDILIFHILNHWYKPGGMSGHSCTTAVQWCSQWWLHKADFTSDLDTKERKVVVQVQEVQDIKPEKAWLPILFLCSFTRLEKSMDKKFSKPRCSFSETKGVVQHGTATFEEYFQPSILALRKKEKNKAKKGYIMHTEKRKELTLITDFS